MEIKADGKDGSLVLLKQGAEAVSSLFPFSFKGFQRQLDVAQLFNTH